MEFNEFLAFRDVNIKNIDHERIVKLFYGYLQSVTGDKNSLPRLFGKLLNINVEFLTIPTGCFNGVNDGTIPPYKDVDFYVRFSNDIKVFVYGKKPDEPFKELEQNNYVLIVLSDNLFNNANKSFPRHFFI